MIDFRVKSTGVILDIAPDASFQIEYENPMFSEDRCPVPFSTEISFLPTQKNKQQMGYLAAMFLPPSIKILDVELYASGVKIMDGMLRFSSVKDGFINYTFSGRNLDDEWSGKIYDKQIYHVSGNLSEQESDISPIIWGGEDGVYAPLLVNASETDKLTYYNDDIRYPYSDCSYEVKYHNYPLQPTRVIYPYTHVYRVLTPAIGVLKILEKELANVNIANADILSILGSIAILGQYKTDFEGTASGIPTTGIDLGRTLPDITSLELFRIILKMFCCALFRDGDRFSMRNVSGILTSDDDIFDWDGKISRNAEVSILPAGGYIFSFDNGSDEDFNPNETVSATDSFIDMFEDMNPEKEVYQVFKHSSNNSVISARKTPEHISYHSMLLCDLMTSNMESYDFQPEDTDGEVFDNAVKAKLARCVPDYLGGANTQVRRLWRMVAIINPENVGDKRGADVIIGRIDGTRNQLQFGDGSIYYEDDAECYNGKSANLRPKSLYENYHEQFAEWCRKRHQVISADLNLSMTDIATFRMWQKVVFSGRMWIVRKLTITIYAGNGRVDVSGEFVSVD